MQGSVFWESTYDVCQLLPQPVVSVPILRTERFKLRLREPTNSRGAPAGPLLLVFFADVLQSAWGVCKEYGEGGGEGLVVSGVVQALYHGMANHSLAHRRNAVDASSST
jgi:hypothetical protein